MKILLLLAAGILAVSAFSSTDDKFIKKYAMMKIYESCFGQQVIREIREEMKHAVAKCAAKELEIAALEEARLETSSVAPTRKPTLPPTPSPFPVHTPEHQHQHAVPIAVQPLEEDKALVAEISIKENSFKPNFDPEKLQQAILSYRPNPFKSGSFPPYPNAGPNSYFPYAPHPYAAPFPGVFPGAGVYHAQPAFAQQAYAQYPPYFPQHFFPGQQRLARDYDINTHVDNLKSRLNGKIKNVTCVMQELGYLDGNLEPTYEKIIQKIKSLAIQDELKADIAEGIDFCKQFSQCIPESTNEKSPFANALMKPMFFFRCYKHKKLEACIMKDVRERFSGVPEDNFDNNQETDYFRRAKSAALDNDNKKDKSSEEKSDDLTATVFDMLFGNTSNDLEDLY